MPARWDDAAVARRDLDEHVLERGLGPQQGRRVLADQVVVVAVELDVHVRKAVLELHARDAADLDAGHSHRLALPGLHRLSVGELDRDVLRALLDDREAEALLAQDEDRHGRSEHHQPDHRQELAPELSDRHRHGVMEVRAGFVAEPPGAARLGGSWVSQATSGRCSGGVLGFGGAAGSRRPAVRLSGLTPWMWKTGVLASLLRLSPASPTKLRMICSRTAWPLLPASILGIGDST